MKGSRVLFVNHVKESCGVQQFGQNVFSAISRSARFEFIYAGCSTAAAFHEAVNRYSPNLIIYNHTPTTMPWLTPRVTMKFPFPQVGVIHEVAQSVADRCTPLLFDAYIAPDPTLLLINPLVYKTGRLIPTYASTHPLPAKLTIGSFGFGTSGKGFDRIVENVQREFDQAVIRFNIPFAAFGDADGTRAKLLADECRRAIVKPGIELVVTHNFLSTNEVLSFLESNTINAFYYEQNRNRGISSVIDLALAVNRPIAVTKSHMFRHVTGTIPSICIEDTSLRQIIDRGTAPLLRYKEEWTAQNLCWDYERIVTSCLETFNRPSRASVYFRILRGKLRSIKGAGSGLSVNSDKIMPVATGVDYAPPAESAPSLPGIFEESSFNRILDDTARSNYREVIELLHRLCPEVMSRKIPEANVQQAFVFESVRNLSREFEKPKILSVGCYEDSAYLGLRAAGIPVEGIDPVLNYGLHTFLTKPGIGKFDVIFATSVLEHVAADEQFVSDIAKALNPGGFAILTCDFKEGYQKGDRIPGVDFRFYTEFDLRNRLLNKMQSCSLHGPANWSCANPDFWFEGINYTFATFTVRKSEP